MSTVPLRRQPISLFPELAELFGGFPSLTGMRPVFDARVMRLEDEMKEGHYVVRAEMPGVDPSKDVDITVRDGQLTIKAERSEKKDFDGRSEFSYGSFVRTVSLPAGADEDTSRPPTTRASSLSRSRFRSPSRPSGAFRCSPPTGGDHGLR